MVETLIDKFQREQNYYNQLPQDQKIWYIFLRTLYNIAKLFALLYGARLGIDLTDVIRMIVMST